jgi:hypothetical protein
MKTVVSEQQGAFYTKNGFIEFVIPHVAPPISTDRDLWRTNEQLKQFILKKLGPIALTLSGKKSLRLGADQWITSENRPQKASQLKELFCLQNLAIAVAIAPNPSPTDKTTILGIRPLPTSKESILFFRTDLLLDWENVPSDVYIILFALPNVVYIRNRKDPHTTFLKQLGCNYGDALKNDTHPLIIQ